MGKHGTEHPRVARDLYPTPAWCTLALLEYIDVAGKRVWEPATGNGHMAEVLKAAGASVYCSDIHQYDYPLDQQFDFLSSHGLRQLSFDWMAANSAVNHDPLWFDWCISNPPFGYRCGLITPFIKAGLSRLGPNGALALLLPVDCDSAITRVACFRDCVEFDSKIVLTKRIIWFKRNDGKREQPKENHAWYIWRRSRAPTSPRRILYAPSAGELKSPRAAATTMFDEISRDYAQSSNSRHT